MNGEPSLYWILPGRPPERGAAPATVGAKAYHLMRLAALNLPVPPGFVLGTGLCRRIMDDDPIAEHAIRELLREGVAHLEEATRRTFGSRRRPLLVSVRSGAAVSMPGMMQTVANVGLTEQSVRGLIRMTGNPRLAWDSLRRLIGGYAEVVHGCDPARFTAVEQRRIAREGLASVRELDSDALEALAREQLEVFRAQAGESFPADPMQQLERVAHAVFASWQSAPAREYRRLQGLDDLDGTAVTVQAMVFGNAGALSGSGVGFTRDPATGEKGLYADFLFGAQGEDVVSGRTVVESGLALEDVLPDVHEQLTRYCAILEESFGDLQDFEFTIEEGELYLLQSRSGKRTPWAALRVAVDFVREGVWSPEVARSRLAEVDLGALVRRRVAADCDAEPVARATSAGIGVASGVAVLAPARACAMHAEGRPCVLVRTDTTTVDVAGMAAADGILTARGGRTSHAAVVARQLGKVCLVGCADLRIDEKARTFRFDGHVFAEGDTITLDGEEGRIFEGSVPIDTERPTALIDELASWCRTPA
ncbi:MAG: PEP/pyruvate-binding domain-containing protein [Planctomycetota bacterium]|jgi:pyruvate,orthophosphate dikinase